MCPSKYLDISQKINLTREATQDDLKRAMVARLCKAFTKVQVKDTALGFHLKGKTGSGKSLSIACVELDVEIGKTQEIVRVLVHGHTTISKVLLTVYGLLFFVVLLAGLLPGSIETGGEGSGAMDALVFIIFGLFIFHDLNKKLEEPKDMVRDALASLEVEFG